MGMRAVYEVQQFFDFGVFDFDIEMDCHVLSFSVSSSSMTNYSLAVKG
jgi:hypothetical protein